MRERPLLPILKHFLQMIAHELNIVLQIDCVTLLALAGILLLRHAKTGL
jgi:hypothetical protein